MKYVEHFNLTNLNTPLLPLNPNSTTNQIFVKRDDFTGIELSGNKVRKLDFLLKEAIDQGAERIITCGGLQSNHCRATAFAAAKVGLKTTLVLKSSSPQIQVTGNLLLNKIVNADIKIISHEEYQNVNEIMYELSANHTENCYIIPEGGSNPRGAWGYVKAFEEIVNQMPGIDVVVVPTGSGGTHAGLLIGKWLMNHSCQIVSVNVCDDASFFKQKIAGIVKDFKSQFAPDLQIAEKEIEIVDGFVGAGYGQVTEKEIMTIKRVAQNFGFLLDPVYTVKAWLGFEKLLAEDVWQEKKIVFVHTGGVFSLFAYNQFFS